MVKQETHPYVFREGKYKDRTLDWVFLHDPVHISRIYLKMFDRRSAVNIKNHLQLAIETLMERIQGLRINRPCPFCKSEPSIFLLLPDHGLIGNNLICCRQKDCREQLLASRPGQLHAIKDFLLLISSRNINKKDATTVVRIFKNVHKESILESFS